MRKRMFFQNSKYYRKKNKDCAGKAEWKISNNQEYLDIEADDYYSLGFLEGVYLRKQIKQMKNFICLTTPPLIKILYGKVKKDAKNFLPYIPDNYIIEMNGIADGSGLNFHDILVQNVYWDLLFGKYLPEKHKFNSEIMGCTTLGAKNNDGSIIIGQTYDFPKIMNNKGILKGGIFPTLSFVSHQVADKPRIFGLRMGAELNLPTAKNDKNVTVIFNIIISNLKAKPTMPFCIGTRYGLEQSRTATDYKKLVYGDNIHPVSHNAIISDKTEMFGLQAIPFENRSRVDQLITNTNRFIYDDWNSNYFAKGNYSLSRQKNAENLILQKFNDNNKYLTENALLSILERKRIPGEPKFSEICRNSGIMLFNPATLAFFTTFSFGLGIVQDGIGKIPI